jgi:tRNA dimethylallyltransferase
LKPTLVIVSGPTAIGKTAMAIKVAGALNAEIISADSRQFYKELKIGVAAPSKEELQTIKHHFIGHLSIHDYYNVSSYEKDVLSFLSPYFKNNEYAVMVGGSGLYIDAVCYGIDEFPEADEKLRGQLNEKYEKGGIHAISEMLRELDPVYYKTVDLQNPKRILRALEVCLATGKPFSEQRKNKATERDFHIIKIGLNRPRNELVDRIHKRVDKMLEMGLLDEVRSLYPYKNLNALNAVGYKEIFNYLDGEWPLDLAIEKIKTNTRRYAKRQITWFNREIEMKWFHPDFFEEILEYVIRVQSNV